MLHAPHQSTPVLCATTPLTSKPFLSLPFFLPSRSVLPPPAHPINPAP